MRHEPITVLTPRLEPVLEATMSLIVLLGLALSLLAVIGMMRHEIIPALLLVAYLVTPLPAVTLAVHLLSRE